MLCAFMYTILHVGTNHKVQLWVMAIPVVLLVREVGKLICFFFTSQDYMTSQLIITVL